MTEQQNQGERHAYKPLPRGDHAITVRLCHECDNWHAEDDSILYNEGRKWDWQYVNDTLTRQLEEARRDCEETVRLHLEEKQRQLDKAERQLETAKAGLEAILRRDGWRSLSSPPDEDMADIARDTLRALAPTASEETT